MTTVLDRDWAQRMATRFGGRLFTLTFTRSTAGAYDAENDPSGPPAKTTANYKADGIALGYQVDYVDGEQIWRGDYSVIILLGTVKLVVGMVETAAPDAWPQIGDTIAIAAPNQATPITSVVTDISAVTQAFVTAAVRGPVP